MDELKNPENVQPAVQKPANPLANYYRQPKVYVRLPSKGKFYPQGALDVSETGDYAVYAMTAKDELMLKTPDALLNGQSTVEVIKSCVPAVLNPWQMPSIDLDAVLIAIRIATYGEKMDVSTNCTSCDHENDLQLDLVAYLNNLNSFTYDEVIVIDPLTIYIRPYNYKEITKTAIKALEQERIFDIVNNKEMSDEQKIEEFGISFLKLTDLTVGIVADSIVRIVTPEGEVSDKKMIDEFINNAPKEIFSVVQDRLNAMKEKLEIKSHEVACQNCSHKFQTQITLDQSNFFAVRS
jgi:hypothetical protein